MWNERQRESLRRGPERVGLRGQPGGPVHSRRIHARHDDDGAVPASKQLRGGRSCASHAIAARAGARRRHRDLLGQNTRFDGRRYQPESIDDTTGQRRPGPHGARLLLWRARPSPSRHRRDACPTRNSQAEQPSYASFYRETKVTKDEWLAKLKEVRAANNILASDECAWVTGGASGTTCSEHFGFDM